MAQTESEGEGMFKRGFMLLAVAATALACLGCGGKGGLTTGSVKGTVLYQGKPLTEGSIQFVPERGQAANGQIGAGGAFTVSIPEGNGAVVGATQIAITATREGRPIPGERVKSVVWLIPERFGSPGTSGLNCEIKEGANDFKIELAPDRGSVTRVE
jgi:hypothetical protein